MSAALIPEVVVKAESIDTKGILETMKGVFPVTAKGCVEALSGVGCSIRDSWEVSPRLLGRFDHIFTIGNANAHFQAIMVVGIQESSIKGFFKVDDSEQDILIDVFGEVANQFCGLLMDSAIFIDTFGILTQSVPQYSVKQTFFPRVWGVDGRIWHGDSWMYMGYAVRPSCFGAS